jgi:hypothetical protein
MRELSRLLIAGTCALFLLAGCQPQYPNEKPVYKVSGIVMVDGQPAEMVQVTLHDEAGVDTNDPTFPSGFTDANGQVVISTHAHGDGAPVGNYRVTFMWGQVNPLSMNYGGPDKLKGRYSDVKNTPFTLQVSEQGPNDLGTVELTTQ